MAIQKTVTGQRDFSAGQLDATIKRGDDLPIHRAGCRQLSNFRILNSRTATNRPGRSVLFLDGSRSDQIIMPGANKFSLVFGNGYLRVYNAAGTQVFSSTKKGDGTTNIPWVTATVKNIVWAAYKLQIWICYGDDAPLNVPQILSWDGVSQSSTWTLSTFAENVTPGGQKRTVFYRLSPQNITLQPSATSGNINLTFSDNVLVNGMIGTNLTYCGRELQITGVTNGMTGIATVIETLPAAQTLTLGATAAGSFNIGDVVTGSVSGAKGILALSPTSQTVRGGGSTRRFNVGDTMTGATSAATGIVTSYSFGGTNWIYVVHLNSGTLFIAPEVVSGGSAGGGGTFTTTSVSGATMTVQLLANSTGFAPIFTTTDLVVGPSASSNISGVATTTPQAVSVWADEVMNNFRGWPKSVFFDQTRLGFCNFPSLPAGIGWSAIGIFGDFYAQDASSPSNAIFEFAPGNSTVQFVIPGMESSEFVFCDNGVLYIPISITNPLKPGSVAFNELSSEGSANVQPRHAQQTIIYVNSSGTRIKAVQAPGAYYRPYIVDDVSVLHASLIKSPIAIAVQAAAGQFEEQYIYALNGDGSVAMSKYQLKNGLLEGNPGWLPWSGGGTPSWISGGVGSDIVFTGTYAPNGIAPVKVCEIVDNTQYLDAAFTVNSPPGPLTPPGGKGPLWWMPNATVTLIDLGTRFMGTYTIDANGFIIPQNIAGENLASAQLVAGQPWTATLEPFIPGAQPGQDAMQRMTKRAVGRAIVYVKDSTGFLWGRLFSDTLTPTSPALGTIMANRREPAWFVGDDPTQPPPLREGAFQWRPRGRYYDPRVAVIKDTPGPLTIEEFAAEVTV